MDQRCVMEVWAGTGGSGYLVAPHLVLTAYHVVAAEAGDECKVRQFDPGEGTEWQTGDVVWPKTESDFAHDVTGAHRKPNLCAGDRLTSARQCLSKP